ncbi:MAG: hypothetical protein ACYDC5_06250 [Candidatus Dormibacteria bacterium]
MSELLNRLGRLGVTVRLAAPDKLGLSPVNLITETVRSEVLAHKAELIRELAPPSTAWADPTPLPVERPPSDPRPELVAESLAWTHLLAYAGTDRSDFKGLYGALHGARCGGALLSFTHGRWRIVPRIDPAEQVSVWHDQAAWEADRGRYLLPHRERLTVLLRLLPTPSRLGVPPDPLTAGVAALRAFGWRLGLSPDCGLTVEHPTDGAATDAMWLRAHHAELAALVRRETDCATKEGV